MFFHQNIIFPLHTGHLLYLTYLQSKELVFKFLMLNLEHLGEVAVPKFPNTLKVTVAKCFGIHRLLDVGLSRDTLKFMPLPILLLAVLATIKNVVALGTFLEGLVLVWSGAWLAADEALEGLVFLFKVFLLV